MEFAFCISLSFWILVDTSFASENCTELQFENFNDTLHIKEGDRVTLRFNVNTTTCSQQPTRTLITVKRGTRDYCKVTLAKGNCTVSDSSCCRCTAELGPVEFTKVIDRTDNGNYLWVWSNDLSSREWSRGVSFNVSYFPLVIKGFQKDQVLHVGERLTLMCTLDAIESHGLVIKFTCGHRAGHVSGPTGFSTVTFNPVTAADNGIQCQCKANWRQNGQLQLTETSLDLTVYDADPVLSGAALAAITVIFVLVASALSAAMTYVIIRRKAPEPALPTLHRRSTPGDDSYEKIPENLIEQSGPPEGIIDVIERKPLSRRNSRLSFSEAFDALQSSEYAENIESAIFQPGIYMYLEQRISTNSPKVKSSQPLYSKPEGLRVDIRCPVHAEAAVSSLASAQVASADGRHMKTPCGAPRQRRFTQ